MGTSETLRSVLEADTNTKRLDELSTARVIGQLGLRVHAEQQKAGPGKGVGPITPSAVAIALTGDITLALADRGNALGYSAPETLGGTSDRRSDVFSLGILMWEALTHQRLFDALNDAAVKAAIKEREIAAPAELNANIPAELSAICMKALARNPADRYQSAKVMAVEIEEMLSDAGYADNNDQIAAYMAELSKKPKLPPPNVAKPSAPQPAAAIPSILTTPAPEPSRPSQPVGKMTMLGTAPGPLAELAPKPAPVEPPAAAPKPAPVEPPASASQPRPPVLPSAAPTAPAKPVAAAAGKPTPTPPAPRETPPAKTSGAAKAVAELPQPAQIISLPPIPGGDGTPVPRRDPTERKSGELLGNWGWQTDSVGAISDDDDYLPSTSSRKTLLYIIGGGMGVMLIVVILAMSFGGSKKKAEPPAAAKQTTNDFITKSEPLPPDAAAPVTAVGSSEAIGSSAEPAAGSAIAANTEPAVGSAASTTDPPTPDTTKPDTTANVEPKPEPKVEPKPEPKVEPKPEPKVEPKPDTKIATKVDAKPDSATKPDKVAKTDTKPIPKVEPKPDKPVRTTKPIAKVEPKPDKPIKVAKPIQVAKADPKPDKTTKSDHKADKVDVESAYRAGIQQFARGDTTGALTSLRTSLAGNPNYPPTWRGLGLVFEKLGEKDQAKAAYKRYLQLSPSAGDADQIRNRLDRLGS